MYLSLFLLPKGPRYLNHSDIKAYLSVMLSQCWT